MNTLGVFFLSLLIFLLVFRWLTTPAAGFRPGPRVWLGALITLAVTIGGLWLSPGAWTLPAVGVAAALGSTNMRGEGLAGIGAALGRGRFAVYILSVTTLAALIYVYVPITTFLTSPGELGVHLDFLLTTNARDMMVVVYVSALLYALSVSSRMKTVLALYALGALSIALLFAYALPFGYPMMTGLSFEQVPITSEMRVLRLAIDIFVVAGLALGLGAALLRYGSRPFVMGLLLVNASLAVAAGIGIRDDLTGGAGGPVETAQLSEQPLRFSPTNPNVLILFLDRFMGSYMESILETDPGLMNRLSGFTWYPRTVSAGENSIAGIHPLLGGYDYLPVEMNARGKPLRDLSVEAYTILPHNFSSKGYRVNVVSPRGLGFTMAGDCSFLDLANVYCGHIPPSISKDAAERLGFPLNELAKSSYTDLLALLGAMRSAPYTAKEVLRLRGPWRRFLDHSAGTTFREWAELSALDDLSRTDAAEPNLNFVSNILAHEPYYMGEDCQPKRQPLLIPDDEVRERGQVSLFSLQHAVTARCVMLLVADYLDYLKHAGVYDNTRIVIVSDHGIVGPVEDHSLRATAGGTQDGIYVATRSVLLVKPRDATGALRVSETFTPNAEVPSIVCEEIGGCVNPYLANRPIEALGRDDPFHVSLVPWQFTLQEPKAFVINHQFVLVGKDPYDANGWKVVRPHTAAH